MSLNNHHNLCQKRRPLAGDSGYDLFAGNGSLNVGICPSWMVMSHFEIGLYMNINHTGVSVIKFYLNFMNKLRTQYLNISKTS